MSNNIKYAFIKSLPVMFGYIFLGIAYGVVLSEAGFTVKWALGISLTVFAGSAQFVMVPLMAAGCSVVTMAVTILFVNFRHVFYGLSFVESFSKLRSKPYMIFSLTDETYSVLCGCRNEDPKEQMRKAWPLIALFDQCYWVTGSVLGVLLGQVIPFDLNGIDYSMTALFIVILVDRIRIEPKRGLLVAFTSMAITTISLLLVGVDSFLLPALIVTVMFTSVYSRLKGGKEVING